MELEEASSSWNIVSLVFLRKLDTAQKKGMRRYRDIALTSVMSKWSATCTLLRLGKRIRARRPEATARGWH